MRLRNLSHDQGRAVAVGLVAGGAGVAKLVGGRLGISISCGDGVSVGGSGDGVCDGVGGVVAVGGVVGDGGVVGV
jgi:hypothetical protein